MHNWCVCHTLFIKEIQWWFEIINRYLWKLMISFNISFFIIFSTNTGTFTPRYFVVEVKHGKYVRWWIKIWNWNWQVVHCVNNMYKYFPLLFHQFMLTHLTDKMDVGFFTSVATLMESCRQVSHVCCVPLFIAISIEKLVWYKVDPPVKC